MPTFRAGLMEPIRAFIAIELPNHVKDELSLIIKRLKPGHEIAVKWVDSNAIHLTLKFLGNVYPERIVDITRAVERVTGRSRPFTLELDKLGAFPNLKSPRVAWVGVGGDVPRVIKLQQEIDRALISLGFTPEKRSFSPHLTLGRVREKSTHAERDHLGRTITSLEVSEKHTFTVERVSLMKSTLTRNGAIYECLASAVIGEG